jgi:hypothetical protein
MTHFVRHLLRPGDYVRTEFKCQAPEGAQCRLMCKRCKGEEQCVCEYEDPPREPDLQDQGECLIVTWLENDAPEECFNGEDDEPVRGPLWQPIVPEWNGDGYEWDYA